MNRREARRAWEQAVADEARAKETLKAAQDDLNKARDARIAAWVAMKDTEAIAARTNQEGWDDLFAMSAPKGGSR